MVTDTPQLIPPLELLSEYDVTPEQFIEHGLGFLHEFLIKRGRLMPNERVLDIGCGPGHHARPLTEYLGSEGSFEGFDISRPSMDFCTKAYAGYKNFRFTHADIHNVHYNPQSKVKQSDHALPYGDSEFDLVYTVSLFTHLLPEDTISYFKEIRRVLKDDGRFISSFFISTEETRTRPSFEISRAPYNFPHDCDFYHVLDKDNPSRGVAYREDWLRKSLAENGFRLCELTYGTWSGGCDMLHSLQDIVLAVPRV